MTERVIVIGSRGSDLALWQANHIKARLAELGHDSKIKIIKTKGDRIQHLAFDKMEGKGFFTKEIETALRDGDIDLAVHSYKDLETTPPPGLKIAAVSERANPVDVLLILPSSVDETQKWNLKQGATVGTSSARRKMQVLRHRPDTVLADIRGNVPTRVNKLREGNFDAIILASAGLDRLELDVSDLHRFNFDPTEFIPAPSQGVLAFQIREEDIDLDEALLRVHHPEVAELIGVERKVLNLFDGGCQLPLGAWCRREGDSIVLDAVMSPRYDAPARTVTLKADSAEGMAEKAVKKLKALKAIT